MSSAATSISSAMAAIRKLWSVLPSCPATTMYASPMVSTLNTPCLHVQQHYQKQHQQRSMKQHQHMSMKHRSMKHKCTATAVLDKALKQVAHYAVARTLIVAQCFWQPHTDIWPPYSSCPELPQQADLQIGPSCHPDEQKQAEPHASGFQVYPDCMHQG